MARGRDKNSAPSQRPLRVGEEVRHALSTILRRGEVREPELDGVNLTVTEVRMSPDLRHANIFLTPLGGEMSDDILDALKRSSGHLRHMLGKEVRLKYMPELHFQADESFSNAQRIETAIERSKQ